MKSESDVLFKSIHPILEKLGYSESEEGEIEHERAIQIGRSKHVFPDVVVSIDGTPAFVLDAKKTSESIDIYERQILSYGLLLRTPYSVITNGIQLRIYDTNKEKIVWEGQIDKTPKKILGKKVLQKKISKSISPITDEQLESAKKTLLVFEGIEELNTVLARCEEIIRDNDGLTGADAFDEISKLLFTKMYFEKKSTSGNKNQFSSNAISEQGGAEYVKTYLFDQVVKGNKDIFIGNERIELSDSSIESIAEILENYTLTETDIDVKGRAFEIFLGKTFTGSLGQFFTPRTIVDFTVEFVNPELTSHLEPTGPYKVIDPACGSGGFLTQVFQNLARKVEKRPEKEKIDIYKRLSREQIYGVDINPRLVRVAKMNMVLHGDGHGGIYHQSGLDNIPDLEGGKNKFDLIITNPPFGNKDKGEILNKFKLGKKGDKKLKKQLREVLFVEQCIQYAKPGGEIAILLPDGTLNNEQLSYVRDYIREHTVLFASISLPDRTFKAAGANSKCSLLFLRKKQSDEEIQPPVFMAVAEEVGFERKTKEARSIPENDLPDILNTYKEYIASKKYQAFKNKTDILTVLNEIPSCFVVGNDHLQDRMDASYYYADLIFDIDGGSQRVSDIARISNTRVNPSKKPSEEIKYVQFSNVEKTLGSITETQSLLGEEAPTRARQKVKSGTVICASVKDSEENVALIPEELDGVIVSTGFITLIPKPPMTSETLYMLLRLKSTLEQVRWKSSGTIMPSISDDEYLKIKVPKLSETQIEDMTSTIKEVERKRKSIRNTLKELSQTY